MEDEVPSSTVRCDMKILATILVVVTSLVASPAFAGYTPQEIEDGIKACEKSEQNTQIEINACAGYGAAQAELLLNSAYQDIRALLKRFGEPGDAEHLLKVQRAWIAFRELACESRGQGSMSGMLYSGCMRHHAEARTRDLKEMIQAECERSCYGTSENAVCKPCRT